MFNSQYIMEELSVPKEESEPNMEFTTNGQTLLTINSREIKYNHTDFPNDTAKQATARIFPLLKGALLHGLTKDRPSILRLKAHKDQPEREITFAVHGIEHNYTINTWTWWLLHHLESHIKKNF